MRREHNEEKERPLEQLQVEILDRCDSCLEKILFKVLEERSKRRHKA